MHATDEAVIAAEETENASRPHDRRSQPVVLLSLLRTIARTTQPPVALVQARPTIPARSRSESRVDVEHRDRHDHKRAQANSNSVPGSRACPASINRLCRTDGGVNVFGWRRNRRAERLMASMSAQEKVQVRALSVFHLSLAAQVHVMTTSKVSATEHADVFEVVGRRQGVSVGRLSSEDSSADRSAAYQARIVVGPLSEFLADFTREDDRKNSVRDKFAIVEGKPVWAAWPMLARYRELRIT